MLPSVEAFDIPTARLSGLSDVGEDGDDVDDEEEEEEEGEEEDDDDGGEKYFGDEFDDEAEVADERRGSVTLDPFEYMEVTYSPSKCAKNTALPRRPRFSLFIVGIRRYHCAPCLGSWVEGRTTHHIVDGRPLQPGECLIVSRGHRFLRCSDGPFLSTYPLVLS
jgi:hypothetical protein